MHQIHGPDKSYIQHHVNDFLAIYWQRTVLELNNNKPDYWLRAPPATFSEVVLWRYSRRKVLKSQLMYRESRSPDTLYILNVRDFGFSILLESHEQGPRLRAIHLHQRRTRLKD